MLIPCLRIVLIVLDSPSRPLKISGITQHPLQLHLRLSEGDTARHDPLKAQIVRSTRVGKKHVAEYLGATLFKPDFVIKTDEGVTYSMLMLCWVILCRLVGKRLIEENLDCLIATLKSLWIRDSKWTISSTPTIMIFAMDLCRILNVHGFLGVRRKT